MAEHYDTTILRTRSRRPRDKGKVEGAVLIVERWILARLRNRRFFSLADLNAAIADLLVDLNDRPMRHVGKSRRAIFEEIERTALAALPTSVFEYAEWKTARVHPDYHIEADKTFYSVPHRLIGRQVDVRLTHRVVGIFYDHVRVASHMRTSQRRGHVSPASLIERARKTGPNTAMFVETLMVDKPHPEQGYRSAMGILSLARRYAHDRLEAACDRALVIGAVTAQLPVAAWHEMIGEPTIADAILDRIIHNAHRIALEGDSMRRQKAPSALTQDPNPEITQP